MKILSISDVITNSSSEVFCYITGDTEELKEVLDTLNRIFGYNQECELTPVVDWDEEDVRLYIDIPYHLGKGSYEYFREGIKALLSCYESCKVDFESI